MSTSAIARAASGVRKYGAASAARELALRGLRPALGGLAGRRLARAADRATTHEELLDLAFGFDFQGIGIAPGQVREEIAALVDIVGALRPRRVLEIGTAGGGTLFLFARVADPAATVISIDLPHGDFGGGYPPWKIPLYRSFARAGQRLELVRADSHAGETYAQVGALLGGEPLDFLFIDGDHTYEGVKHDFELYSPLVRPGGVIAFHDIAEPAADAPADGPTLLVGEVPKFWQEIRERFDSRELVYGHGCFGIGVLQL